jgi:hypothetical protein
MRKEKDLDHKDDMSVDSEEDRVIADMNIEGMPWYVKGKPLYKESSEPVPTLSKKELRRLALSAMTASLLIASVFLVVFFLFIMFCINIWFK